MDFNKIKQLLKDKWNSLSEKLLYTPSESDVQDAVKAYLTAHPDWIQSAIARDPALANKGEEGAVAELLTYQGLHAIALHDKAHNLYVKGVRDKNPKDMVEARRISQGARRVTGGIEIHPGARIGENFFIDHGAGVVIGETAEIGDNVFLYHTITLGSTGNPKDIDTSDPNNPARRHPKLGNNVTIGNGAQLLGPVTVEDGAKIGSGARIWGKVRIGRNAVIYPGVEVRENIPDGARVVGKTEPLPGVTPSAEHHVPITQDRGGNPTGRWAALVRTRADNPVSASFVTTL